MDKIDSISFDLPFNKGLLEQLAKDTFERTLHTALTTELQSAIRYKVNESFASGGIAYDTNGKAYKKPKGFIALLVDKTIDDYLCSDQFAEMIKEESIKLMDVKTKEYLAASAYRAARKSAHLQFNPPQDSTLKVKT